jgi:hypothetical protein
MPSIIALCENPTCKSVYQDMMYGKRYRVFNSSGKSNAMGKIDKHACTICGLKKVYIAPVNA